jgi:NAD-dependent deacetylase
MQIGMMVARNPEAVIVDINLSDNPFRQFAARHDRGIVLDGPGGKFLPELLSLWEP